MGRTCTVCRHENRQEVERLILARAPYRVIGGRYDLSHESVRRHALGHLPAHLAAAASAEQASKAADLLAHLRELIDLTRTYAAAALAAGHFGAAIRGAAVERGHIDLLARLRGHLNARAFEVELTHANAPIVHVYRPEPQDVPPEDQDVREDGTTEAEHAAEAAGAGNGGTHG